MGAKHKVISIKLRAAHLRTSSCDCGSVSPLFAATYTHAQPAPPSTRIARIALALHTPANLAASSGCCRRVCARLGLRRAALFGALSCSARVGGRNVPDAPRHPAASSRIDKAGRPRRHTPGAEQTTLSTFAHDITPLLLQVGTSWAPLAALASPVSTRRSSETTWWRHRDASMALKSPPVA